MITAKKARKKAIKQEYKDIKKEIKKKIKEGRTSMSSKHKYFLPENVKKLIKLGYEVSAICGIHFIYWGSAEGSSSGREREVSA